MAQTLSEKMVQPMPEGMVRGTDVVKIYWTAKAKHVKEGDEVEVHPELAKKLIASGKATGKAPKAK